MSNLTTDCCEVYHTSPDCFCPPGAFSEDGDESAKTNQTLRRSPGDRENQTNGTQWHKPVKTVCYVCGQTACKACSQIIPYQGKSRCRVCTDCIIDRFPERVAVLMHVQNGCERGRRSIGGVEIEAHPTGNQIIEHKMTTDPSRVTCEECKASHLILQKSPSPDVLTIPRELNGPEGIPPWSPHILKHRARSLNDVVLAKLIVWLADQIEEQFPSMEEPSEWGAKVKAHTLGTSLGRREFLKWKPTNKETPVNSAMAWIDQRGNIYFWHQLIDPEPV